MHNSHTQGHQSNAKKKLARETSYAIHNKVLETSNTSRYLGISITDNLTWSRHTAITAGKENRVLGFLRQNINDCSTKVNAISYTTMVRPIMEHASAAWDPHLQKDISHLESTATSSQILLRRLHKQNTRMCWWQAKGATLGKRGSEEEEQPPKSPSQHQHRPCWHHHRLVPTTEWPQNAGSPAFLTCKDRLPSPLPSLLHGNT